MESIPQLKVCHDCGQEKPTSDFQRNKRAKDGFVIYCKPCAHKIAKQWRDANPERNKANKKRRDQKALARDPEKVRNRSRRWKASLTQEQKDQAKMRRREYNKAHPEIVQQRRLRRTQRLNKNASGIDRQQWDYLCEVFGRVCLKCGYDGDLSPDHIIPLCLGGLDHITNIQPLCKQCNTNKGDRDIIDYRDRDVLMEFLRSLCK